MSTETAPLSTAKIAAHVAAVAGAHGTSDAVISRRVKAVAAALADGMTVKTLASSIATAAASDPSISPVTGTTLGYARGVLSTLDKMGVSLASAPASLVVVTYRAIMRHGVGSAVSRISAAGIDGGTEPADKTAAAEVAASAMVAEHTATRAARTGGAPADGEPSHVLVTDRAAALATIAAEIARGQYVPTPDFIASLEALVSEVTRVTVRNYTASPARVPALKAVGA